MNTLSDKLVDVIQKTRDEFSKNIMGVDKPIPIPNELVDTIIQDVGNETKVIRVIRKSKSCCMTIFLAYYYLKKLWDIININEPYLDFVVCLIIADKMIQDETLMLTDWSMASGCSLEVLARHEISVLKLFDFRMMEVMI